jgi:hypothetical protein
MKPLVYWRTDTERDAIFALASAVEFLQQIDSRPYYWRWFVLSVHAAVQGALVLVLTNGNLVHVQKPGVSKRMLAAFEGKEEFPDPYMDNFVRLYSKARNQDNMRSGASALPAEDSHERAMISLDEMRDEFVHFNSKSWSIEVDYILDTSLTACEVMRHIFSSGSILWHHRGSAAKASRSLKRLETTLRKRVNNSFKADGFGAA